MTGSVSTVTLTDEAIRGIELLATSLDWPCYVVDLAGCVDKAGLLERTADVMRFPSWFGHNWDAWFDCLVDLPAVRRAGGGILVLRHVDGLREHSPEALDTAITILVDAAQVWRQRNAPFRAFVEAVSSA